MEKEEKEGLPNNIALVPITKGKPKFIGDAMCMKAGSHTTRLIEIINAHQVPALKTLRNEVESLALHVPVNGLELNFNFENDYKARCDLLTLGIVNEDSFAEIKKSRGLNDYEHQKYEYTLMKCLHLTLGNCPETIKLLILCHSTRSRKTLSEWLKKYCAL